MSQFRDHQYQQQASPAASYPGTSADIGNPAGTPGSRIIFSPGAGPMSASKLLHTPDRGGGGGGGDGADKGHALFSPTHSSGGGYRTSATSSADQDPFVTPSSKSKCANPQLSADASSFRPFYDSLSSNGSDETQTRGTDDLNKGRATAVNDQVSPALSTELHLSRCLEFTAPSQSATTAEVEAYLAKLASLGSPCQGTKQLFAKSSKVYVRFTNIRDACVSHRNVHLCGAGWTANFIPPKDLQQIVNPGDSPASNHEGQLDLLAVLLHNAPMDVSQVEPLLFKLLKAEGDLFAFHKDPRSEDGAVKATLEYADFTSVVGIASKMNGIMVDGLHIRIGLYQPDLQTRAGRAAPQNEGIATPMPTPGRYAPPDHSTAGYQGQPGVPFSRPTPPPNANPMIPGRHQPTPPTSGPGGPPQVALVPMMLRNPYTPGTPIILDPFGPHGQAMSAMGGGPFMFPPGGAAPHMMGPQGYEGMRPMTLANRYGNRRGAMRVDRNAQFNNNHHNQVDVNRIREGVDVRTTIMLRNIPNKVDQRMLKAIIDESSWGKYDFMYLRIDFANDCNVGYAFINFADPLDVIDFANARDNQRWNCFRSDKVAEISYATIQGRDCLVQKFRNSSVMLEAPHYRPKLYYTLNGPNPEMAGREEEFPGPDNPSKMKRSCENAEHVGLFTPHLSQYYRDEQRRRRSQYDRGTRMAALEEFDYDTTLQRIYMPQ